MSQDDISENPTEILDITISNASIPELNEPIPTINPPFVITGSPPTNVNRCHRRGSSTVKMLSEDYNMQSTELPSRRASSPEKRSLRNSVVRLLEQQDFARRFSAPEKTRSRRSSSISKTLSEEQEETQELSSRRSSRSGSITKMTSEDNFADDECSRRSSRAEFTDFDKRRTVRRGSSVVRMLSEEQHEPEKLNKSESPESYRKSIDNSYKHSLESISEHKPKKFYPSLESPTLDCLSNFANSLADSLNEKTSGSYINFLESVNQEYYGAPRHDNDNRSGEWNFFWKHYSGSTNNYSSNPYMCPTNSMENLSDDSAPQIDKGGQEKIMFTLDEVNEALHCIQRVSDILKDALKRTEENDIQTVSFYFYLR